MDQILSSWKEIAAYFGKGVRTVQRWEQSLGLPVRRPAGASHNIVFARTGDLHQWLEDARSGLCQADPIKTILLVEADEKSLLPRRAYLEQNGYLVFGCRNRERAVDIFKRGPRVDMLIAAFETGFSNDPRMEDLLALIPAIPAIALHQGGEVDTLARCGWHPVPKTESPDSLLGTVQKLFAEQEARKHVKVISFPSNGTPKAPVFKAEVS